MLFLKVVEDNSGSLIQKLGVKAFPTFRFYVASELKAELKGADPAALEGKVGGHY